MKNENSIMGILEKDKIEFLKEIARKKADITDFAVLLGGACNRYEENRLIEDDWFTFTHRKIRRIVGGQGDWWLSDIEGDEVYYVNSNGYLKKDYCDAHFIGLRPTIRYSHISSLISNMKEGWGVKIVEYGKYPQYLCPDNIKHKLETNYKIGKLKKTGKIYTVNINNGEEFIPMPLAEYEFNGNKYIRYVYSFEAKKMLSNKEITKFNNVYWVKVEPIEWIVYQEYDICIAYDILCANIPFDYKYNIRNNFSDNNAKWFLNTFFLKDIVPIENNQKYFNKVTNSHNSQKTNLTHLISEHYQKVVLLLEKLKDYDFNKYLNLKKELDEIIEKNATEINSIANNSENISKLHCKKIIDNNTLNNLISLENEIELIININKSIINYDINYITYFITNIINSLEKKDINNLDEIDKISELYLKNIDSISLKDQINLAKQICLLYLFIIKNNNIDSQKIENNVYILRFKRYLYLLIMELVENKSIIINTHITPCINNDISFNEILKIINNIEFANKDTKKLVLFHQNKKQ